MITTTSPVREYLHVHLPRLKKYARYLTRMTSAEPDDLVQETCVIALAHERQYTRGSLGADSGDVARSFQDHVARCSDMMSLG